MSAKITQRDVLEAFIDLEAEAKRLAAEASPFRKLALHDAAIRYGHLVRRVSRAGRSTR